MSARTRQSTASTTPGPRRQSRAPTVAPGTPAQTIPLPEYQPPQYPLSADAQERIAGLLREYPSQKLTKDYQDAISLVSEHAGLVSEEIYHIDQETRRQARHHERHGTEPDADVENRATSEIEKIERMTNRMEGVVRRGIDGEKGVGLLATALREVQANARTGASRHAEHLATQSQLQTQTQTQTQTSRVTMDIDFDDDGNGVARDREDGGEDDDAQDQAQPPPPPPPPPALVPAFEDSLQRHTDRYDAQSLAARYASHPLYAGFKRGVHEGRHGPDAAPLEHNTRWFSASGAPKPGVTVVASGDASANGTANADAAGGPDDEDDDIILAREIVSTKCPLTLREFEHPVTSALCPHSFEAAAIHELLAASRPPQHGRRAQAAASWTPSVQCPVPGCDRRLTAGDLREDRFVAARIARAQRLERVRREMAAAEEEGAGEGEGGAGAGETIESGEESMDDVDAVPLAPAASARSVKSEGARRGRAAHEEIEDDGDGFEE